MPTLFDKTSDQNHIKHIQQHDDIDGLIDGDEKINANVTKKVSASQRVSSSSPAIQEKEKEEEEEGYDYDDELFTLYSSLSSQASRLLHELTLFQDYLTSHPPPDADIFLARFSREVRREADVLGRYGRLLPLHHHRHHHNGIDERMDQEQHRDRNEHDHENQDEKGDVDAEAEIEDSKVETKTPGLHNIRSSNITSYFAIWEEAKRNEGLMALKKKVKYFPASTFASHHFGKGTNRRGRGGRGKGKETVMVDVVANHGRKWVKVWTKSQEWLQMDMAKEGLVELDQDEDEDENKDGEVDDDVVAHSKTQRDIDGFRDLKLVKMACEFVAAAKTTRVGHRHPKVHFILPKIHRGRSRDLDIVLTAIERIGIVVSCSGEGKQESNQAGSNLVNYFERMLAEQKSDPCPNEGLLNLDCTVLIALISDISHCQHKSDEVPGGVEIPAHYHGQSRCDIVDQFLSDQQQPLLPSDVYPILSGKQLSCTSVAANHLRKIVHLMGTATEMLRADILLGNLESDRARSEWNNLSIHRIGDATNLPVRVVDFDKDRALMDIKQQTRASTGNIDFEIAQRISKLETRQLSDLNKAVFIHGWSSRITTFTLNRVVSGYIHRAIDDFLDEFEAQSQDENDVQGMSFCGPRIEVCARERSLIGSEKTCRNK